jgi:GNAT superfamily N-acetyltransferase
MRVIDVGKSNEAIYFMCLEDWNKMMHEVRHIKEKWYREMKPKGLRVKMVLTDEGHVGGMIEYMPIEYSYAEGSDLFFVNCIWVHGYEGKGVGNVQGRGLGKALLKAAEDDVKTLGKKGLVAWGISEKFWMTASWYQKQGYEKVDQEGWMVLVWKPFSQNAVAPRWIKGEYTQELIHGKVKVTAFYSGQCPSENIVYHSARVAAGEFGEKVVFEEIDMSSSENRKKYGLKGGLYINGENLFAGPPPTYEDIKKKIEDGLSK